MGSRRAVWVAVAGAAVAWILGAGIAYAEANAWVRAAAVRAADATMIAVMERIDAQGPVEVSENTLWAGPQPLDADALGAGTAFRVYLSAGTEACLGPRARDLGMEPPVPVRGVVRDGSLALVERCDPVRDPTGQIVGVVAVRAPVADWGSGRRLAVWLGGALVLAVVPIGLAVASLTVVPPPEHADADAIQRAAFASSELRQQVDALEAECARQVEATRAALAASHAKAVFLDRLVAGLARHVDGIRATLADAPRAEERLAAVRVILDDVRTLVALEPARESALPLAITDVDLQELVDDVVSAAGHAARLGGNTVDGAVAPETPTLRTDRDRLRQVIVNLVSNAAKHTREGAITLAVAPEPGDRVRIEVRDTGQGISPEQLAAIFGALHPLERAVDIGTSEGGGLGIGLPIVRALVDALGGEVTAASVPGAGTVFTVVLPREAPTA